MRKVYIIKQNQFCADIAKSEKIRSYSEEINILHRLKNIYQEENFNGDDFRYVFTREMEPITSQIIISNLLPPLHKKTK
jgi:hypothetical protein